MYEIYSSLFQCLIVEQVDVCKNIMMELLFEVDGFFFLYGYGGTGKNFI